MYPSRPLPQFKLPGCVLGSVLAMPHTTAQKFNRERREFYMLQVSAIVVAFNNLLCSLAGLDAATA